MKKVILDIVKFELVRILIKIYRLDSLYKLISGHDLSKCTCKIDRNVIK